MAAQLYWSITAEGVDSTTPPPGLECAVEECNSIVALYVSDESDPDAVILDAAHEDVVGESLVKGRRVAVFLVTLLNAVYVSATKTWEFVFEYDETALVEGIDALNKCDVCQAECLSCEVQAKLNIS